MCNVPEMNLAERLRDFNPTGRQNPWNEGWKGCTLSKLPVSLLPQLQGHG
jgi:hypothetical protein